MAEPTEETAKLTLQDVGQIYAGFMEEVKIRLRAIDSAIEQIYEKPDDPDVYLAAEFCYLQLRFIAELIALAALIAHNDIPEANSNALTQKWNADKIFDRLSQINEHCYPTPVSPRRNAIGQLHFELLQSGFLTRGRLKEMYHRCGENLHRGILKQLIAGKNKRYDIPEMKEWADSIARLLAVHVVMLPALNGTMVIEITGEGGHVRWHYAATSDGSAYAINFPPSAAS